MRALRTPDPPAAARPQSTCLPCPHPHAEHTLPWSVPPHCKLLCDQREPPPRCRPDCGIRAPWELALSSASPRSSGAFDPGLPQTPLAAGDRRGSRKGVWVHVHRKRSDEHTLGESHGLASPHGQRGPRALETAGHGKLRGCRHNQRVARPLQERHFDHHPDSSAAIAWEPPGRPGAGHPGASSCPGLLASSGL